MNRREPSRQKTPDRFRRQRRSCDHGGPQGWPDKSILMILIRILFALTAIEATAFAAAPDSVAGKIFRDRTWVVSIRRVIERTRVIAADGNYTLLVYGRGSPLDTAAPTRIFLQSPDTSPSTSEFPGVRNEAAAGKTRYSRTGENTARLEFLDADGSSLIADDGFSVGKVYELTFTSDQGGTFQLESGQTGFYTFTLTGSVSPNRVPVLNTSLRGEVVPEHPLIAGFYVPGAVQREILIRVSGPGLIPLGVPSVWSDPDFEIYAADGKPAQRNSIRYSDWSGSAAVQTGPRAVNTQTSSLQNLFGSLGEFPLEVGSKDAVELVRLPPGAYTIVASAAPGDPGGEALIEIYPLP